LNGKKRCLLPLFLAGVLFSCTVTFSAAKKIPTILVCPKTLDNSFWGNVRAGAMAAGKEYGARVIWKGPTVETDIAGQLAIVEDFVNKRVDAIALAATDVKALYAPVKKALNAKIPVVSFDSGLDPDPTLCLIATDNYKGAFEAGEALARLIGQKGKIACIPLISNASTSILREKGFNAAIARYPGIRLVAVQYSESDVAKGMAVAENILTANPDLDGIFAANEPGAMGAAQAIKARGLSGKVKLVAFDASPMEIEMLQNGTIQALIVQNPYNMGYLAVKTCMEALTGKKVPKRIDTGVTVVTMDNFYEPRIQQLLYPAGNSGK
jgi:ribose transport system substrate-binding protein